ncbi:MAG: hypothetical protein GAK32_02728 [Pseudomonas fluorescens]|nr:MAG: hypothetical protein GAK32_02728 [Pseudomonas fluorescens]
MTSSTNGTIGHCTANLQGDADFSSFAATTLMFYPNDTSNTWSIIASGPAEPISQLITLNIPKEGNVTNKLYTIGEAGSPRASIFWVKSVFGTWHNYQGIRGTVTVTVDESLDILPRLKAGDSYGAHSGIGLQ